MAAVRYTLQLVGLFTVTVVAYVTVARLAQRGLAHRTVERNFSDG